MAPQTHPEVFFNEFILRLGLFSHPYYSRNLSYRAQGMGMLHLLQKLKEGAEGQRKHRGACARTGGRRETGLLRTGEF